MLKERSYTGNKASIYICDMCRKELTVSMTNKYSVLKGKHCSKMFDLCDVCNEKLIKSIKRYAMKHETNKMEGTK